MVCWYCNVIWLWETIVICMGWRMVYRNYEQWEWFGQHKDKWSLVNGSGIPKFQKMVEGNHCVADHANTSYSFIVLLQPAVNGLIRKTVNESSTKYVYVMSAYSKGPIHGRCDCQGPLSLRHQCEEHTIIIVPSVSTVSPWLAVNVLIS